nr:isocitrate/isopropylmalate family dehydrogenase [Rhodococcus sp. (in: high G+C Gram-positive bacteria)]
MRHLDQLHLGLLHADGIGPEVVDAAAWVVEAAVGACTDLDLVWTVLPVGKYALATKFDALPRDTLRALSGLEAWILGPDDAPSPDNGDESTIGRSICRYFDMNTNILPAKAIPLRKAVVPTMDLVVVRENTEGLFVGRNVHALAGESDTADVDAASVREPGRSACERIAHRAFGLAERRRSRVTVVCQATGSAMRTELFKAVCTEVAALYPQVEVDERRMDTMHVDLVQRSENFDVVLTENLSGDVLCDLTVALSGSELTAPSLSCSDDKAMAQARHGCTPDAFGRNRADPTATIASAAMMIRWLGDRRRQACLSAAADVMEGAIEVVSAGTADAGKATTMRVASLIVDEIRAARSTALGTIGGDRRTQLRIERGEEPRPGIVRPSFLR